MLRCIRWVQLHKMESWVPKQGIQHANDVEIVLQLLAEDCRCTLLNFGDVIVGNIPKKAENIFRFRLLVDSRDSGLAEQPLVEIAFI